MRALLEGQGTLTFIDAAQVHLVNEKECLARPSPSPFLKKTTRIHPYIFFLGLTKIRGRGPGLVTSLVFFSLFYNAKKPFVLGTTNSRAQGFSQYI